MRALGDSTSNVDTERNKRIESSFPTIQEVMDKREIPGAGIEVEQIEENRGEKRGAVARQDSIEGGMEDESSAEESKRQLTVSRISELKKKIRTLYEGGASEQLLLAAMAQIRELEKSLCGGDEEISLVSFYSKQGVLVHGTAREAVRNAKGEKRWLAKSMRLRGGGPKPKKTSNAASAKLESQHAEERRLGSHIFKCGVLDDKAKGEVFIKRVLRMEESLRNEVMDEMAKKIPSAPKGVKVWDTFWSTQEKETKFLKLLRDEIARRVSDAGVIREFGLAA
jgi:hypothetical protein